MRQRMRLSVVNIAGATDPVELRAERGVRPAMTRPAAMPCPEASPKRTASRPSGSGTKS